MIDIDTFQSQRSRLFAIAYRMLGSASEAEDVIQDAYLRSLTVAEPVRAPAAYLSTIVTRLCLDRLKSARAQREEYIGPWLPEPILTGDIEDAVEQRESISLAMMMLLEQLNPMERAAFLLHEVFDYSYHDLAAMLETSPANCRQLVHRATQRLNTQRARFHASAEQQRQLAERFMAAAQHGDLANLVALLAHDATCWTDSGGKVSAARNAVTGAPNVAKLILGMIRKGAAIAQATSEETQLRMALVNGVPGVLFIVRGQIDSAATFASDGQHITAIHVVRNPDKLAYVQQQFAQQTPS